MSRCSNLEAEIESLKLSCVSIKEASIFRVPSHESFTNQQPNDQPLCCSTQQESPTSDSPVSVVTNVETVKESIPSKPTELVQSRQSLPRSRKHAVS